MPVGTVALGVPQVILEIPETQAIGVRQETAALAVVAGTRARAEEARGQPFSGQILVKQLIPGNLEQRQRALAAAAALFGVALAAAPDREPGRCGTMLILGQMLIRKDMQGPVVVVRMMEARVRVVTRETQAELALLARLGAQELEAR